MSSHFVTLHDARGRAVIILATDIVRIFDRRDSGEGAGVRSLVVVATKGSHVDDQAIYVAEEHGAVRDAVDLAISGHSARRAAGDDIAGEPHA
jgi:hypothetical protein